MATATSTKITEQHIQHLIAERSKDFVAVQHIMNHFKHIEQQIATANEQLQQVLTQENNGFFLFLGKMTFIAVGTMVTVGTGGAAGPAFIAAAGAGTLSSAGLKNQTDKADLTRDVIIATINNNIDKMQRDIALFLPSLQRLASLEYKVFKAFPEIAPKSPQPYSNNQHTSREYLAFRSKPASSIKYEGDPSNKVLVNGLTYQIIKEYMVSQTPMKDKLDSIVSGLRSQIKS